MKRLVGLCISFSWFKELEELAISSEGKIPAGHAASNIHKDNPALEPSMRGKLTPFLLPGRYLSPSLGLALGVKYAGTEL